MKFGHNMDVDELKADPEGQGHRSKVNVTRAKNRDLGPHLTGLQGMLELKGHMGQGHIGQGQRSRGSGSV